ncbi:nac domain-containing protein 43 [Nicotiana attenuata]|uniref:Nac domain-containing protein 43 n=1 Tax=Nicotiana attenuata TaxID=49451 RepID=A0A1J6JUZ1_NICAT|nr:nac domain-containing protein 43 [Nicotiana attenuata]
MEYSQAKCFSRPMGHRFHPTDREVLKYLIGFVRDEPLHSQNELMPVADLYADKEPWQIFEAYDQGNNNNNTRYFITPQKKEKPTWKRVSRTVGKGTWKPQSKGREVFDDKGRLMGYVKSLKYIPANKSSNNVNGEWLMTEYSLFDRYLAAREIKNKGFVICKIKKKGKPGDEKKGNNIDEVVNDENMRDIEEFINTVLQEDVQVEDNGIRLNGIAKLDDQENNIIQYVEGDQVRDHVLGLLDSPEDIVDVNDHEEYVEDCVDEGDEVQVHLLEEYIDSVLQSEDVQAEDNRMMSSNDIIAKDDQENMEYQVEDNQHATFWASAEDIDLDTINFF